MINPAGRITRQNILEQRLPGNPPRSGGKFVRRPRQTIGNTTYGEDVVNNVVSKWIVHVDGDMVDVYFENDELAGKTGWYYADKNIN